MMESEKDYYIDCLGMAIVNYTNETNKVSVKQRQGTNDKCFDFAKKEIELFLSGK